MAKINYPFIFEFDSRHNLDWHQLAEVSVLIVSQKLVLTNCKAAMFPSVHARAVYVAELPAVRSGCHVLVLACPASRHHRPNPLLSSPNPLPQESRVVALF